MAYRIKGWHKFQHFKDRRPPWIKLYRDLLDDLEWHSLDPLAAKSLVMLWLIASEADGLLPELKKIAFRLRLSEKATESIISKLSHWLERDDISAISSRYQSDAPETETETETETDIASRDQSRSAGYQAKPVNGNAVAYIPLVGGREWGVSKEFLAELETAYPAVDGPATLREIRAWCVSNPNRCKTENGVRRFINNWFSKDQNHGA